MRRADPGDEDGTVRRRLGLVLLAGAAPILLAGTAGSEESSPVPPQAEAWYTSGLGAVAAPLQPAGTLHVGMAGGQESDRTYLRFELGALPDDAEVDGVTVTIPVAADAGTQAPDSAEILACGVPSGFEDGGGGDPPEVDCEGAPQASFVAGDTPSFTIQVSVPAGASTVDVALVPGGGDGWHVGFDSRNREGGSPATATATYEVPPPASSPAPATSVPAGQPSVGPAPTPVTGGPPLALPDLDAAPIAAGQVIAGEAEVTARPAVTSVVASPGYRYPAIFAVPLALLVVVAIAGQGLTSAVRLREDA